MDTNHNPDQYDIIKERLRQARLSFNLALATTATCAIVGFAGVGLMLLGKAPEGVVTTTGGLSATVYCLKLARDANDRLDELAEDLTEGDRSH
ncbi:MULTISPECIES: TRADD-N-associated membrane domain-containing protein [Kamptonema]|uniref:TRADD-N-associated membrane domain-containing protein n=1 Tax=Kamptonema TaxID=1501433 RepID=UPI0001DAD487|nr:MULTISPECIES: hypothetical protein [Kamptonema]CBN55876.1 hypothetical protein OSCI_2520003 [Kamptonema sp. PCC 6506]